MNNQDELNSKKDKETKEKKLQSKIVPLIILLFLLILTSLIAYTSVRFIYGRKYQNKSSQSGYEDEEVLDDNLLSAIFIDDPDTPEVDYIALRDFNTNVNKVNVIMFPTDAIVTLSSDMKKSLSKISDDIGDTIYLTDIGSYYGSSVEKYEQTVKAMEEVFQEEIPSYEAMDFDAFMSYIDMFSPMEYNLSKEITYYDTENNVAKAGPGTVKVGGHKALGIVTFFDKDNTKQQLEEEKSTRNTEPDPTTTTNNTNKTISTKSESLDENGRIKETSNYLKQYVAKALKSFKKRSELLDYINDYYQLLSTNGNAEDITKYIDNFMDLDEDKINFYTVKGSRNDDGYTINSDKAASVLTNMMEEVEEDSDDESEKDKTDSKTLDIEILNGAYIQGIAAEWKKKLENKGYTITSIDTYGSEAPQDGLILVTEKGMGKDLKEKYFKNAEIKVVDKIDSGADIQIILGKGNEIDDEE